MNRQDQVTLPLSERKRKLQELPTEAKLHELAAKILRELDYSPVRITHGVNEHGKDVVAIGSTRTGGTEVLAVVAKRGNIKGAVGKKGNLSEIQEQVQLALDIPYESPDTKRSEHVTRVLVICNGIISNTAQQRIRGQAEKLRAIDFWDVDQLEHYVTKYCHGFYYDVPSDLNEYSSLLREKCSDISEEFRRHGSRMSSRTLEEIFIEPRLIRIDDLRPPQKKRRQPLGKTKIVEKDFYVRIETNQMIESPSGSVILMGEPGSGKTFAIKRACFKLSEAIMAGSKVARVPFLISATALAEKLDVGFEELAVSCCVAATVFSESRVREIISERPTVLFVDGLHVVSDEDTRISLLARLRQLDEEWQNLSIVVTMRVLRFWKPKESTGFSQYLLLQLNNAAMRELLQRVIGRSQSESKLLSGLLRSGLANSLPKTPLVITLLGILHEHQEMDEIPANIAELYGMFFEVYLGKWTPRETGDGSNLPQFQLTVTILEILAWRMHEARLSSILFEEVRLLVSAYIKEREIPIDARLLYERLFGAYGILEIRNRTECIGWQEALEGSTAGDSFVEFEHISFQEYFAAQYLKLNGDQTKKILTRFEDPWWSNVLTYYAGLRKDVPDLLEAIVNAGIPKNPLSSLSVSLQLGHLLQAAYHTPAQQRLKGCLHGTDLIQAFFVAFAHEIESGKIGARISEMQMMFALGVLFSMAYGSSYVSKSQQKALDQLLDQYSDNVDDFDRARLIGLRAFCSAAALADRGDWDGMDNFVSRIGINDPPLLKGAAAIVEESAITAKQQKGGSGESHKAWNSVLRRIRKLASKKNRKLIQKYATNPPKTSSEIKLLDTQEKETLRLPFANDE